MHPHHRTFLPAVMAAIALGSLPCVALAGYIIPFDNALIPVGLRPGDSFHLVFATSNTTNRYLGGGDSDC